MAISAGSVAVRVVPSAATFAKDLQAQILPKIRVIGAEIGKEIAAGIGQGIGDPLAGPLDDSTKKQRSKAPRQGEDVAGAFARGFQDRLKAAFAALPKAEIDADSSAADRKIYELRARLFELSGTTIGVDIDEGAALAELAAIKAELESLGSSESVQVRVDTAAAMAELAAVQTEVDHLDGDTANIRVNANVAGAVAGLASVGGSLATVATGMAAVAAIPIGATVGAGILSLVGPLGAAGLGFAGLAAVAVPAFSDITKAQKAQQAAQAASTGTAAQAAAANKRLAATMAGLSPAERGLLKSWTSLRTAFSGWAKDLQPDVLPLFSRGIALVKAQLPGLTPIVRGAAGAVDGLIAKVATAAKSPFWVQFRQNLTNLVPTAITGLGQSAGNVVTGLAGIVNAFLPYAPQILSFLTRITAGFARWGQGLGTSSGFAQFIAYVKANLPLVLGTVGSLVTSVTHVVSALAPLGPLALGGFGLLLRIVSGLKPGEIQAIAIAIGLIVVAVKAWRIAQLLLDIALDANPIGLIVVGIAALIAAVVLAYNHVGWFRAGVQAAWAGIRAAALLFWNYGLKPIFTALSVAVRAVGAVVLWLWHNVIAPGFNAIVAVGKVFAAVLLFLVIAPLIVAFKLLQAEALFLWHNVMLPAWHGIQALISAAWRLIHPALSAFSRFLSATLGPAFRWLWHTVVTPVWNGIKAVISTVWNSGIKPIFNAVKSAIGKVGDAFHAGASAIKTAWNKIRDYTKAPVNFVIGTVYNKGIVGLWNKVMGWLHLPKSLQLGTVPQLAAGGELSAAQPIRPMMTNGPAAIVGEGNPRFPEYVIPTDPKYRGRARGLWAAAGSDMQMLAGGGILGSVLKSVKGVAGKVVGIGKDALDLLASPKTVWDKLAAPILNKAKGLGTSPWGKAAAAIPPKMMDQAWNAAKQLIDTFKSAFGGGGSAMVELAKTQLGYHEGAGNSNKYSHALGRPSEEWCADFINWLALKTGNRSAVPWTASAPGMARGFGNKYHSGTAGAVAGDIVFFGPSKAGIYHVGLASGAGGGGSVPTIAGNSSNMVRAYTGTGVAGYAHPAYPNPGSGIVAPGSLVHASTSAAKAWARQSLKTQGWGQDQFSPLERLWTRESGWRWNALNRSSGAYGIPQSLPASKMRSAGADYRDNAGTQIKWGLGYIKGRYGSPAGAWSHSQRTGWYDEGGWLPPGPSLVYNGTGRPEPVFTGNQFDDLVDGRSGGGAREYHAHFDGWTAGALEGRVRSAFHSMEVSNGNRERARRRR